MKNKNLKILSFILTMVFMFSIAFNTVNKAVGENPFENITTEFNQFLTDADNGKDTLNVFRTAGNNRYQTSAYLSKIFSSETTNMVIITSGENFPDALTATALAGAYSAPILLTEKSQLSTDVINRIREIKPEFAFIIGGEASVSIGIEDKLDEMGLSVARIAGVDRYKTANKIANTMIDKKGASFVFIVNGGNFADALSISAVAYREKAIILLSDGNSLPGNQLDILEGLHDIVIVGGESAVSKDLENFLKNQRNNVLRISGNDRFETAFNFATFSTQDPKYKNQNVNLEPFEKIFSTNVCPIFVNGLNFADALSAAPWGANENSAIYLTPSNTLPDIITENIDVFKNVLFYFRIAGGIKAVSKEVENALSNIVENLKSEKNGGEEGVG